jgi:hypothetical protein
MWRVLLYLFLAYLAFQFIFNFLIPIYRTTRQVKKGLREMNSRVNEFMQQQQASSATPQQPEQETKKEQVGEYIDFEEIK